MPDKIDVEGNLTSLSKRTMLSYIFFQALCIKQEKDGMESTEACFKRLPPPDMGKIEVSFICNGVELPVVEAFKALQEEYDTCVKEAAANLLRNSVRFKKLYETLDKLENEATWKLQEVIREELGVILSDED